MNLGLPKKSLKCYRNTHWGMPPSRPLSRQQMGWMKTLDWRLTKKSQPMFWTRGPHRRPSPDPVLRAGTKATDYRLQFQLRGVLGVKTKMHILSWETSQFRQRKKVKLFSLRSKVQLFSTFRLKLRLLLSSGCGFKSRLWELCPRARFLQALDTFGKCQTPGFSLGVSQQNMHKITNLWKLVLNIGHRFAKGKISSFSKTTLLF